MIIPRKETDRKSLKQKNAQITKTKFITLTNAEFSEFYHKNAQKQSHLKEANFHLAIQDDSICY